MAARQKVAPTVLYCILALIAVAGVCKMMERPDPLGIQKGFAVLFGFITIVALYYLYQIVWGNFPED